MKLVINLMGHPVGVLLIHVSELNCCVLSQLNQQLDHYEPKILNGIIVFPDVDRDVDEREEVVDRPRGDHESRVDSASYDAAQRVPRPLVEPEACTQFFIQCLSDIVTTSRHGQKKVTGR